MSNHTVSEYPDKESAERSAFLRFAARMGEESYWVSVESRQPPEPDLLCVHAQRGPVAFELVSLTDPNIAKVSAGVSTAGVMTIMTSDPSARIIRSKLKKSYKSPHSIELLVYTDHLIITPDAEVIPAIKNWVGNIEHPFAAVWFMGEQETCCLWSG